MPGKAGLKAGLIGGAVLVVLTLLGLIPIRADPSAALLLVCCCFVLEWLVYVVVGVLAGLFLTPPRTAGSGAGAGAVAGVISGLIGGTADMIVAAVQGVVGGGASALEMMDLFKQLGTDVDPGTLRFLTGPGGRLTVGAVCCLGSLVIGVALGAIGGAIFSAAKSE